jgi:two-component system response regulator HupR/HoxA
MTGDQLRAASALHAVALARTLFDSWWGLALHIGSRAEASAAVPAQVDVLAARGAAGGTSAIIELAAGGQVSVAAPLWHGEELAGVAWVAGLVAAPAGEATPPDELAPVFASVPVTDASERARVAALLGHVAAQVVAHWRTGVPGPAPVRPASEHPFSEIVGRAPSVLALASTLLKVVKSHATVLVHGESGTGKELIARAIHYHGPRAKGPFVVQNCSAFNDNLLESALFGHMRGAFTGAVANQKGLFEVADGGTFFLDEIGDMSPSLQVKLLRVLQEGTFTPVGGTKPVKVDVRIIAASHKDLAAMVAVKQFREDLFYRVNVLKITVPPLRERAVDIPMLAAHFLHKHGKGRALPPIAPAAMAALVAYPWPGNIRELENEMERALVLGGDLPELGLELLSPRIAAALGGGGRIDGHGSLRDRLVGAEADILRAGLVRHAYDLGSLAEELAVPLAALAKKCRLHGLLPDGLAGAARGPRP